MNNTYKILQCVVGAALLSVSSVRAETLAEQAQQVLDQTDTRQRGTLESLLHDPYPPKSAKGGPSLWHYENFALAAYGLDERTEEADAGLLTLQRDLFPDANAHFEAGAIHWHAYLQQRIYWLYSSRSEHFPGRMSLAAENAILEMLWEWAGPVCRKEFADLDKVWWVWGSENHHLMAWVSFWGAAQIFEQHPDYKNRSYSDGTTPAEMAAAFDAYFKQYASERAAKGLLVEIASPTYAKYSLNTFYNLYDFADDPVLKQRMGMLLDLYWADWSIEQIDGVRGGSRHRSYAGRASNQQTGGAEAAWYHFGIGVEASKHPGTICAATTSWRPSPVVMALALDAENREPYAITSRRPGLSAGSEPMNYMQDSGNPLYKERGINRLAPEGSSLLRTSWVTPDFIAGMSQVEPLPREAWWAASAQNRWNGVIFAGHPTARIFTQRHKPKKGSVYNAEWGVQNKGVMILQRLRARKATGQMIWFDHALERVERDEWVFVDAPQAYAAVRIAKGGGVWREDSLAQRRDGKGRNELGEWLELNDVFSPIIIEVARKQDCASFAAFQSAILANKFSWVGKVVTYRSDFYDTTLTLPVTATEPALIDGEPVNYSPDFAYDSPFIQGEFGSGVITLRRGNFTQTLDFTK